MEILVVLYFIDMTFGGVGQGRVSRNDLATWFMVSKPTVARFMKMMMDKELVSEHQISSKVGHGIIIKYSMTAKGKQHLDEHFDAAYELYKVQVARVIGAIKQKYGTWTPYVELTPKEKRQIAAGQKGLFD